LEFNPASAFFLGLLLCLLRGTLKVLFCGGIIVLSMLFSEFYSNFESELLKNF